MIKRRSISLIGVIVALTMAMMSCGSSAKSDAPRDSLGGDSTHRLPDTLRVATLYSPTSYFLYRDVPMGYDYALAKDFADAKGMALDLQVAPSLERAIELLDSAKVDLIAYQVPVTAEYKDAVVACGPTNYTYQVLVQPRGTEPITDVTQLVGRDIYVEKNSKYQYRLENLDSELGGGLHIHTVDRDTIITEDLLAMVASGNIPLAVVDSDIARLNKTYYPNLDISLELSFRQSARWAVSKQNAWMGDSINTWLAGEQPTREQDEVYKRYFELSKTMPQNVASVDLSHGKVSAYDNLFKKYAAEIGWDWRMIAAQAYVESKFSNNLTSWAGARGMMQIMPSTARANGVSPEALTNPETSIKLAAKVLKLLDKTFEKSVPDAERRRVMVVAAYNSGQAHIIDAIALARKLGKDPSLWHGNVAVALQLKSDPKYYNDPVCKYGYFRGSQTINYVDDVLAMYDRIKKAGIK